MKKRILALLLAVCLLSAVSAFAAETAPEEAFRSAELASVYADGKGTLLACDLWNKVIWNIAGEKPEVYAGYIGAAGPTGEAHGRYVDADSRDEAFFLSPYAAVPYMGGYAVSDTEANVIRLVTESGVRTIAGTGDDGSADGGARLAVFSRPTGLAVGENGELYIADTGSGCIRVLKNENVTTLARGLVEPTGLCRAGGRLYVAETGRNRIVCVTESGIEPLAGSVIGAEESDVYYGGFTDGPAANAEFDHPQGVAVGADGTVYIGDTLNHAVRMLKDGRVYSLAASGELLAPPVSPRGLALVGDTLYAACESGVETFKVTVKPFADVAKGSWYEPYAAEASMRGIVKGTSETTFSPTQLTSRAMFVTMLSRVHRCVDGAEVIDGKATFPDIAEGSWYAAPARWSLDKGIVQGMDGRFVPDGYLTREQAAVMLCRYAQMLGLEVASYASDLSAYADNASVSAWAVDAMRWAVGAEIIRGADGNLNPQARADRAQIATVLLRFMDTYGL